MEDCKAKADTLFLTESQSLSYWRMVGRDETIEKTLLQLVSQSLSYWRMVGSGGSGLRANFTTEVAILIILENGWKTRIKLLLKFFLNSRNPYHTGEWLEAVCPCASKFMPHCRNPYHTGEWLEGANLSSRLTVWDVSQSLSYWRMVGRTPLLLPIGLASIGRNPYHTGEWLEVEETAFSVTIQISRNPYHTGEWLEDNNLF